MSPDQQQARRAARLAAVQALYQMELGGATSAEVIAEFDAGKLPRHSEAALTDAEGDAVLFKALIEAAINR